MNSQTLLLFFPHPVSLASTKSFVYKGRAEVETFDQTTLFPYINNRLAFLDFLPRGALPILWPTSSRFGTGFAALRVLRSQDHIIFRLTFNKQ